MPGNSESLTRKGSLEALFHAPRPLIPVDHLLHGELFSKNGEWVKVCYSCGQAGHVAKDCLNPLKKGKGESGGKGKGEQKGGTLTGGQTVSGKGYKSGVDMYLASGKGAKDGKAGRGGGS